ncbi:MAG: DedA family protein [Sulfurimonas sp.]|nr:DedA family protein [Sulfurimonas sp.]MDQ7060618.1 DedA family protein [Sulfurimonas sp.]
MPQYTALFFASSGNILAIIVNYYLGFLFYEKTKTKLSKSRIGKKSFALGEKYGYYALFLSWLPIIGDPLTLVGGILRLRFLYFILIAGSLRIARYYFLTFMI